MNRYENGSIESCRPKHLHAENLDANEQAGGVWRYTLCGHLLTEGYVFHPVEERHRVTCRNCLRSRIFKDA